jgi:glycerol-3-phosphate dehydrogenase
VLSLDEAGAPLLNVFGGKITTYRKLAEEALAKLAPHFPQATGKWTARAPLPGGDFPYDGVAALRAKLRADHPYLSEAHAARLIRAYGTESWDILGTARSLADLGRDFGATLTQAELTWLMTREYARSAADVVWRRGKFGLRLTADQIAAIDAAMAAHTAPAALNTAPAAE